MRFKISPKLQFVRKRLSAIDGAGKVVIASFLILVAAAFVIHQYVIFADSRPLKFLNPLSGYFSYSRQSLKKVRDLKYLPYLFYGSKLPTYHLWIGKAEMEKINAGIPLDENLSFTFRTAEYKNYVPAYFKSPEDDFVSKIKIRLRGLSYENWSTGKKAYRIKFNKQNLFSGASALNLFLPRDRVYFVEMLNSYRAKKLGLLATDFEFVKLEINGRYHGMYLASEPFTKEWLAKNDTIDTNNVFTERDGKKSELLYDFKSMTAEDEYGYFEELSALRNLVTNAPDEEFYQKIGELLDLDKFYKWQAIAFLARSDHQSDSQNSVLLFRKETGKFEYIPWDVEIKGKGTDLVNNQGIYLADRIFKNEKFFKEFKKELENYVGNHQNLEDDLKYYDGLAKRMRIEFYKDHAKLDTNSAFDKAVKELRGLITANFQKAKEVLEIREWPEKDLPDYFTPAKEDLSRTSFRYFDDIFRNIDDFVSRNRQFEAADGKTVVLKEGAHIFTRTVIVPKNLKLVIEPGAKLFFLPKTSLVSYGPVFAAGTAEKPITMTGAYPSKAWGVFGLINAEDGSVFKNIRVSGGSTDLINGVEYLSQFSVHNSTVQIESSVFENSRSDDALHAVLAKGVIKENVFRNNQADGLDIDYSENMRIENNVFTNTSLVDGEGGDGIDLSGSNSILIKSNRIKNYKDKCISVGEWSVLIKIEDNILTECDIGIAVKDKSDTEVSGTVIVKNRSSGVSLYNKKPEFILGGTAKISDSILWENSVEINADQKSEIAVENSTVMGGYPLGEKINATRPDLEEILR